jgi:hypothetical protein
MRFGQCPHRFEREVFAALKQMGVAALKGHDDNAVIPGVLS